MHAARCFPFFLGLWLAAGCRPRPSGTARPDASTVAAGTFAGSTAGQERTVAGIALCWCPAGTFLMGSPPEEPGRRPDEQQVTVTLSRGFWMGKYEITQAEWKALSTIDESTLLAGKGDRFPIYGISYDEAAVFCATLTAQARRTGELPEDWTFRMPTEAEWEYACRAGAGTAFAFGAELATAQANFGKPYNGKPDGTPGSAATPVGSYPANAWGLHDMHGNEFELCMDWYHSRLPGGTDPDLSHIKGAPNRDGTWSRVRRGGAWVEIPRFCRSAVRLRYEPHRNSDHIGFRVVAAKAVQTAGGAE